MSLQFPYADLFAQDYCISFYYVMPLAEDLDTYGLHCLDFIARFVPAAWSICDCNPLINFISNQIPLIF